MPGARPCAVLGFPANARPAQRGTSCGRAFAQGDMRPMRTRGSRPSARRVLVWKAAWSSPCGDQRGGGAPRRAGGLPVGELPPPQRRRVIRQPVGARGPDDAAHPVSTL